MEGIPRTRPRDNPGYALDESAEEDDSLGVDAEDLESLSQTAANPMEKAIVQLTRVCTALAKPSAKKSNTIEQLLDGSGLEKVGDGFGSTGARKNAIALRALRRCLVDQPEYIYSIYCRECDGLGFSKQSSSARGAPPSRHRAWVARKPLPHHQSSSSCAMGVGCGSHLGCHALIQNNVKEARARCALIWLLLPIRHQSTLARGFCQVWLSWNLHLPSTASPLTRAPPPKR